MAIDLIAAGYDKVIGANPGEFLSLPAGGYICNIVNAEITKSKAGDPMLVLFLDIAEGDFKRYFNDITTRARKLTPDKRWDNGGIYRQLIYAKDGRVSPFLKGLLAMIIKNNPTCKIRFDHFDPEFLIGLQLGFVFGAEESEYNGKVFTKVFPKFPKDLADIREGNFTVPEPKLVKKTYPSSGTDTGLGGDTFSSDDSPF